MCAAAAQLKVTELEATLRSKETAFDEEEAGLQEGLAQVEAMEASWEDADLHQQQRHREPPSVAPAPAPTKLTAADVLQEKHKREQEVVYKLP